MHILLCHHTTASWAFFISVQLNFNFFISLSNILFHVFFGRPVSWWPRGVHLNDCLLILLLDFLSASLIQFHFQHMIVSFRNGIGWIRWHAEFDTQLNCENELIMQPVRFARVFSEGERWGWRGTRRGRTRRRGSRGGFCWITASYLSVNLLSFITEVFMVASLKDLSERIESDVRLFAKVGWIKHSVTHAYREYVTVRSQLLKVSHIKSDEITEVSNFREVVDSELV